MYKYEQAMSICSRRDYISIVFLALCFLVTLTGSVYRT